MSTGIALSGLASGLDTNTMVTQLMAISRAKLTKVQYSQDAANGKKAALNDVASSLSAFKSAADALKSTANGTYAQTQTVESSDTSRLVAAKISGTGIGGHTIKIDRLASSAQQGFKFGATSFAAGTLKIYSGTDPSATGVQMVSIDVKDGASLSDVATSINASSKSPVSAAVITDADGASRLVLSSKATGSTGDFTVDASGMPGNELSSDPTYTRTGATLDAQYEVDGSSTVITSHSNVVENAIPGVRLTLKGVSTTPVTVTTSAPDVDRSAITTKIKAFVNAYNTLITNLNSKTTEKPVANPQSTSDAQTGTLYGDSGLTSLMSQLRSFMSQTVSGLSGVASLSDLGITVPPATGGASTDDAKLGKLQVDDTKLGSALDGDWTKVSGFFDQFSNKLDAFVGNYTGTGKGILDGRITSAQSEVTSIGAQIDSMNLRLTDEQTRLQNQFSAMETALSKAQSEQSWLTGQIAKLG
jgi:flagellar hook-associated protein 2